MLDLAGETKVAIFQASTRVYGDPEVHPQKKHTGIMLIRLVSALVMRKESAAPKHCSDHYRQFGTNIKVARIFNTYGPKMQIDDGRVISNFIVQALKEKT